MPWFSSHLQCGFPDVSLDFHRVIHNKKIGLWYANFLIIQGPIQLYMFKTSLILLAANL